jgi:tetratricopeptide (TPR) repeat protein
MGRRLLIAGTVAALAAAVLLLGGALRGESAQPAHAAVPEALAAERLESGFAAGDTPTFVARLEGTVRAGRGDTRSLTLLGLAYQQRFRETGDPSYLGLSGRALRRALATRPEEPTAIAGLASLALARHRFRDALALARRAQRLSPGTATTYGAIGDALLELGRYDEAFAAFDRMAALKPGLSAYSRVSYAQELLGRRANAIATMRLALDAAGPRGEPAAWTLVQLGKLYWSAGRLDAAARHYRSALQAFPGYVYAFDALAQVEAARGRLALAIDLERRAVDRIPLPQFVGALGDLHRVAGQEGEAQEQYATIGAIERLLEANGVRTDLETALFDVDHGVDLPRALVLARAAQRARPSIEGEGVLAWALARNGRCREALHWSKRVLRLGTVDAARFFQRGMIERCLGRHNTAARWFRRALDTNPHFSLLWAPVARRYST